MKNGTDKQSGNPLATAKTGGAGGMWRASALLATTLLLAPMVCAQQDAQDAQTLTLQQAVSLALVNSHDVDLAQAQYTVAEDQARVIRAEFRPNLYTGSGIAYTHGFPEIPGGQPPDLAGVSYSQALFDEPLRGQLHAAEDRANNQKVALDHARDSVILRAATSYLELAMVQHSLALLGNERTSAQKIIEVITDRVSSGRELPIEITRAQLTTAKVEQRIVQLESREQILSDELRYLDGLSPDRPIAVSAEELPASPSQAGDGDLVRMAIERSIPVAEAENERTARQHLLRGERGGYFPTVDLVGQYSLLSTINHYDEFYTHFQRNNFNVGFLVRIPLFGARTGAHVALARSQLAEAQLRVGTVRNEAQIDAEQQVDTVREQDAAREVARLDLKLAQENLAILQTRFDEGRVALEDLEQAHLDESEKWVAFLNADFAKQQAQLVVMQTTGQLARMFH